MANNSTRNYILACTIPAAVAVATYFWATKKKKRQRTPRRRGSKGTTSISSSVISGNLTESVSVVKDLTESVATVKTETGLTESALTATNLTELVSEEINLTEIVAEEISLTEIVAEETNLTDSSHTGDFILTKTDEINLSLQNNEDNLIHDEVFNVSESSINLNNFHCLDMATQATVHYNDISSHDISFKSLPSNSQCDSSELCAVTESSSYCSDTSSDISGLVSCGDAELENSSKISFSSDDSFILASSRETLCTGLDENSSQVYESSLTDVINDDSCSDSTSFVATEENFNASLDEQDLNVNISGSSDIQSNEAERDCNCDVPQCVEGQKSEVENHEILQCEENTKTQQCDEEHDGTQQCDEEHDSTQQCEETSKTSQSIEKADLQCVENTESLQCEEEIGVEVNISAETPDGHDHIPTVPSPSLSVEETELQNLTSAYGSASHSPELDSLPNGPSYSEFQSEGSSDSGKGGSDINAPSTAESYVTNTQFLATETFSFHIPQHLCGRMIGYRGQHVKAIKTHSGAEVVIQGHPYNPTYKLCCVTGSKSDIDAALRLIRSRFPAEKFPELKLTLVNPSSTPVSSALQLHIPCESVCHVFLCYMINPGHFFLQQPTHPTYPRLELLTSCMTHTYSWDVAAPEAPLEVSVICVTKCEECWCRVYICEVYPETSECLVKFLDHGGYSRLHQQSLKQLKYEYATLPFQAEECFLAGVAPINETNWTEESLVCFQKLATGLVLEATVASYDSYGTPYVTLRRTEATEV
ncbi:A kinase (PRKA) anchor protein 1, variant 2 [Chamberlinius hualienensis]